MSAREPKVSIGFPVYNGAALMRRALDSLLGQSFLDFELIIADNCSTDDTAAIYREYAARDTRITYHRHSENIGAVRNYRHLLEAARGEYFFWAPHDDWWDTRFLESAVELLDSNPDASAVLGIIRYVDGNDHPMWSDAPPYGLDAADKVPRISHYLSSPIPDHLLYTVFRRSCFRDFEWSISVAWEKRAIMRIVARGPVLDAPAMISQPQIVHKTKGEIAAAHALPSEGWTLYFLKAYADVIREMYRETRLSEFLRLLPVYMHRQHVFKLMAKLFFPALGDLLQKVRARGTGKRSA